MKRILGWAKGEVVLLIALAAAVISCFFVPPDGEYGGYIDWKVILQLFSLMAVVQAASGQHFFEWSAQKLLGRMHSLRTVGFALVGLCFFGSMLVTNDVALLTLVPFTLELLYMLGMNHFSIFLVVMLTLAANIGSALTPVGNPQNLFLYARYAMDSGDFFAAVLPMVLVGGVLLMLFMMKLPPLPLSASEWEVEKPRPGRMALYGVLFVVALLSVFRVLDYRISFAVVLAALLIADRPTLKRVDYALLATFGCFFVFVGNLGRIPAVSEFIAQNIAGQEKLVGALTSQVISNVPAAVLLSEFTEKGIQLLKGVNAGGCGTLIASLASLISFKFYIKSPGARPLRYLGWFTAFNLVMLLAFLFL